MPTLFHLIRHGTYGLVDHALGGRQDHPLSHEGIAQAELVAQRLAGRSIVAVVSSPVRRAQETAEIIAHRLDAILQMDQAFTEIDFAAWSGRRFDELHHDPAWRAWNAFRGTARVPGGEAMLEVQARAVQGLLSLAQAHADAEVAVVSHADVIKAVLMHFLGSPLDMMGRLEVGPASLSQLLLFAGDARVLAVSIPP